MTTNESKGARANRAAKATANHKMQLATTAVLAASLGPPVLPMWLPVAEVVMFFRRPHLPSLARSGAIPKPMTAVVAQLTQLGTAGTKQGQGAEKYLEMAIALARATAVVPPAEAMAAMDTVDEILSSVELREPLVVRADWPNQNDYAMALAMARAEDAAAMKEARTRAMDALASAVRDVDEGEIENLFAPLGAEATGDQYYLVAAIEEAKPGTEDRSVCLHRADLVEIVEHLFSNVPGAMSRFRR